MNNTQRTIAKAVSITGVGIHTGAAVNMTFHPAAIDHGFVFQRTDLAGAPLVPALVENVVETSRGTTLAVNNAKVHTVEHVLAALMGLQIDNVLITLDGPETPIADGSSIEFIEVLESAGLVEQEAARKFIEIKENFHFYDAEKDVEITLMPADSFKVSVLIDYNSPVLGTQHAVLKEISDFKTEIASCRTFCFLHELELLLANNLIKGGDINNAIVVVDQAVADSELNRLAGIFNKPQMGVSKEGILNNVELRFVNEPARHKLLDVIGDLALLGRPIKAHVVASKPGHSSNVAFGKEFRAFLKKQQKQLDIPTYNPSQPPVYDVNGIMNFLPHRYPFLLVDKITELTKEYVIGVKNVTMNEPFFQGHFPGNPVMPGVLTIEAMAQTGGILCLSLMDDPGGYWTYFLRIDNVRFKDKVLPGDTLIFKLVLKEPIRRGICQMVGQAFVGNKLVVEAELMAQLVKK
ncbi:MAG: bifunctional UDP-3-O-[3-hydroxymyristoyl] N-acetylglucosamine deacetylase/3-hydroxyacyl-ACP dehydratase [Sphingobacteriaceae bacterium]|nr:bifunctional UDP-3-O-[3-hydroxymyristoyl] N-acetylglucosamine deacetylase/3-hydroxyacyl-ACP dehydratase [Sphingobacteriaceae bacterium]